MRFRILDNNIRPQTVMAWALLAPLTLAIATHAQALTQIEGQRTIGAGTPTDDYELKPGATLNAIGADMGFVLLRSGATFNMNGGTVNSGRVRSGVDLMAGSSASISNGATIIADSYGVRLNHDGNGNGANATVADSHVQGRLGAAYISQDSTLNVTRSTLVATGENRVAVDMFKGGTLNAQDSTITGTGAGLRVNGSTSTGAASINLQGTRVEGQQGPAILVGRAELPGAAADIVVGPGSSLVAGNGNLLEVVGSSRADMRVEGSHLQGDVRAEAGSTANLTLDNQASLTGRLENVAGLTLNNQGRWNMVEDSQVGSLAMNDGVVSLGEPRQFLTLELGTLSGNGTFIMDADFATGETDFLKIGTATGSHGLLVGSSGNEPASENSLHIVHADAGDAQFSLVNGPVDLGAFSYELQQRGNDWYLDGSRKIISPSTGAALALFGTAPTVWYGELSSLRSRMGELRLDERKSGAWMRSYGNKYNVSESSGVAYSQNQQGVSLGADAPLPWGDGQWLAGALAGYSTSDLNVARGASGEVKSYYLGLYTTWLDAASGYYFDGVVKVNRFDNDAKVNLSDGTRTKGSYDNMGVGASLEFGRHIPLDSGYFVEPFTQWSAVNIQGDSYRMKNGLKASNDDTQSLLGKAGATVGRNFDLGEGRVAQPYVRMAYVHEFVTNNQVKINQHHFDNDLSGSRGELGVGVAVSLMERWQVHADFDYSNGDKVEQPWGANIGVHYSW